MQTLNPPKTSAAALQRIAAWRAANRQKVLAAKRRYYRRHKQQWAAWKERNPEKTKSYRSKSAARNRVRSRQWRAQNPQRVLEHKRKYDRSQCFNVTERYLRKIVARHHSTDLAKMVPKSLIEAMRANLMLKRLCQNQAISKN